MQRFIAVLLLTILTLAACVPIQPAPDASIPRPTRPPQDEATQGWPEVAGMARAFLAGEIGVAAEDIEIVEVEAVDWPDGCLGIFEPDLVCTMAITPGYRIVLRAGDTTYTVHSDRSGNTLRLAPAIDDTREPQVAPQRPPRQEPPLDAQATALSAEMLGLLAAELGVDPATVTVVAVEAVDWPDACLEVYQPDEMCATVITPGYRIALEVDGKAYVLHTNAEGDSIRVASSPNNE